MTTTFTNLLNQTTQDNEALHTSAPETLADTLRKHAKSLTNEDLTVLVAGLREQRTRWNAAQAQGSKTLVTSKKIPAKRKKARAIIPLSSGFTIKKPIL